MAKGGSSAEPATYPVFIDTNLDTHLAMIVSEADTVLDLKEKILVEHSRCFPTNGKITIHALKVRRKACFYHLSDSMLVKSAFHGVKNSWFLHVEASKRASIPDSSLLPQLGKGDLVNQVVPIESQIGPGYVGGEVAKVDLGLKLLTDQREKSYLSDSGKRVETEVLKKQDLGSDQDRTPETSIRRKKDKRKKRLREIPSDDISAKPHTGYNTKKQRANEEKVEDSSCNPIKDQFKAKASGTCVSSKDTIQKVGEKNVVSCASVESHSMAAAEAAVGDGGADSPGSKDFNETDGRKVETGRDDLNQMAAFGGSKVKKSKKHRVGAMGLIPPSAEVPNDHSNDNKTSSNHDGQLGDGHMGSFMIDTTEKDKALPQSGYPKEMSLEATNSKCKSLVQDEPEAVIKDGMGSPNVLDAPGILVSGSRTDKRKKKSKKTKATSGLEHADTAENKSTLRLELDKTFSSDNPNNGTNRGTKNLSETKNTKFSKIRKVGPGDKDIGTDLTGRTEIKENTLLKNGDRNVISSEATNFKSDSMDHNTETMKIQNGVGSCNLLDVSHMTEVAPTPSAKKKKKSKKYMLTDKHPNDAEDVIPLRLEPDTNGCLHGDLSAEEINKDVTVLSQAEKTKISEIEDGHSGDSYNGTKQIDKTEVEKPLVQKGDPKAMPLEEIKKDDQGSEGEKPSSKKRKKSRARKINSLNQSSDAMLEAGSDQLSGKVESSLDSEKSHNLINNVGHPKKPQVVGSDTNQLQGPLSKDEQSKLALQHKENASITAGEGVKASPFHDHLKPEVPSQKALASSKVINSVGEPQLCTFPGVNTNVSSKVSSAALDVSTSSTESKEGNVDKNKGHIELQTPSRGYIVAARKSHSKEEVLNNSLSEKSLLATPKAVTKETSIESSEDDAVSDLDASTQSPSDSSSSDDSKGNNDSVGHKIMRNGGKGISKSKPAADMKSMSLDKLLRSSRSYKKAKLKASQSQAEDDESQPIDFVPDSLA